MLDNFVEKLKLVVACFNTKDTLQPLINWLFHERGKDYLGGKMQLEYGLND